jgi:hypothetical protein
MFQIKKEKEKGSSYSVLTIVISEYFHKEILYQGSISYNSLSDVIRSVRAVSKAKTDTCKYKLYNKIKAIAF